jgi:peptidylprolyl isomerase
MKFGLTTISLLGAGLVLAACGTSPSDDATSSVDEAVVESGDTVSVQYIGRLAGDADASMEDIIADCAAYEVFDTSYLEVAQACDLFVAERDYSQDLVFRAGAGTLIPGFEAAVQGAEAGETVRTTIDAADAYGERSDDNILPVPADQLPPQADGESYEAGDTIATPFGEVAVVSVDGDQVSLDMNHPLAGEDLIFDIMIVSVDDSTRNDPFMSADDMMMDIEMDDTADADMDTDASAAADVDADSSE